MRAGHLEGTPNVFRACVDICRRLAAHGLIHCDLNECEPLFARCAHMIDVTEWMVRAVNLLINGKTGAVTVIDFPQVISARARLFGSLC